MEDKVKIPERKRHNASLRCELASCMGEPKKKIEAEHFVGSICAKCWAVYDYIPNDDTLEKKLKKDGIKKDKENLETKTKTKKKKPEAGTQFNIEIE